jgi:hypothetical protein
VAVRSTGLREVVLRGAADARESFLLAAAVERGLRAGEGFAGRSSGGRTTFSSGTTFAPVPFVSVSRT